jgi:hypothetical protein
VGGLSLAEGQQGAQSAAAAAESSGGAGDGGAGGAGVPEDMDDLLETVLLQVGLLLRWW